MGGYEIHDLIKTGDYDSFPAIRDGNGEVVLAYCRRCKRGEAELTDRCVATVGDLVRLLVDYPKDLPVYLADWSENYASDYPLMIDQAGVLEAMDITHRETLIDRLPRRLTLGMDAEMKKRRGAQ